MAGDQSRIHVLCQRQFAGFCYRSLSIHSNTLFVTTYVITSCYIYIKPAATLKFSLFLCDLHFSFGTFCVSKQCFLYAWALLSLYFTLLFRVHVSQPYVRKHLFLRYNSIFHLNIWLFTLFLFLDVINLCFFTFEICCNIPLNMFRGTY